MGEDQPERSSAVVWGALAVAAELINYASTSLGLGLPRPLGWALLVVGVLAFLACAILLLDLYARSASRWLRRKGWRRWVITRLIWVVSLHASVGTNARIETKVIPKDRQAPQQSKRDPSLPPPSPESGGKD
ncbi:MAG: hypothetical protein WCB86_09805 [Candidatus Dormiibacterota bacterium]